MAKVHAQIIECIKDLNKKELEKLLIKAATQSKQFHDYLLVNLIDHGLGEEELFENTILAITNLQSKKFVGRSFEKQEARKLMAIVSVIAAFDKNCIQKKYTVELLLHTLSFEIDSPAEFDTYYQPYDNKVKKLVQRVIATAQKKLHPDLAADYNRDITKYKEWIVSKMPGLTFDEL
jgi:hypothetical protein